MLRSAVIPPVFYCKCWDSYFEIGLQLFATLAGCVVLHAIIYKTRSVFSEPRRRRTIVTLSSLSYVSCGIALLVAHFSRDQVFTHFREDHRLKWAGIVHLYHGVLA